MFNNQDDTHVKANRTTVWLVSSLVLLMVVVFSNLVFRYVIEPRSSYQSGGYTPAQVVTTVDTEPSGVDLPKVTKNKLDWSNGFAYVDTGAVRLAEYRYSAVTVATQFDSVADATLLKNRISDEVRPLLGALAVEDGFSEETFRVNDDYNTLVYVKNPDTLNLEEIRYDVDLHSATLVYSSSISLKDFSFDVLKVMLSDGTKNVGVKLDTPDLAGNVAELLSQKITKNNDYYSLTYKDGGLSSTQVRIEYMLRYTPDSNERVPAVIISVERTVPTIKLN